MDESLNRVAGVDKTTFKEACLLERNEIGLSCKQTLSISIWILVSLSVVR